MEEHIQIEGRILTVLAGTMFRVELDNKHQVLATISGKMRKRFVRLTVGDRQLTVNIARPKEERPRGDRGPRRDFGGGGGGGGGGRRDRY